MLICIDRAAAVSARLKYAAMNSLARKTKADNIPCHQHGLCQGKPSDSRRADGPTKSLAASIFCFEFKAFCIEQDSLARGSSHPTKSAGSAAIRSAIPIGARASRYRFFVVFSALRRKTRHTHPHSPVRLIGLGPRPPWLMQPFRPSLVATRPRRCQVSRTTDVGFPLARSPSAPVTGFAPQGKHLRLLSWQQRRLFGSTHNGKQEPSVRLGELSPVRLLLAVRLKSRSREALSGR